MTKILSKPRVMKRAGAPKWIKDKADQKRWMSDFTKILRRDFRNSDATILAILADDRRSELCAWEIRSYVNKAVTTWWYEESKTRGEKYKSQLELAIPGLRVASVLCGQRSRYELASTLGSLADEFSEALGRCKRAFATKPHGRDRDHSFLLDCRSFLEASLKKRVTDATLANLVNAGFEADGEPPKNPITEEQVRKNLTKFARNNPLWVKLANSAREPFADEPDSK